MANQIDSRGNAFLDGLRELNRRLTQVERLVAGGKRVETVSGDPGIRLCPHGPLVA